MRKILSLGIVSSMCMYGIIPIAAAFSGNGMAVNIVLNGYTYT